MIPSIRWADHTALSTSTEMSWFPFPPPPQESENLEKENAALRKEVKKLSEEAKYLSSVLSNHEPLCTGLTPQNPELLFSPHHGGYHQHIALPHYQHWPAKLRRNHHRAAGERRLTSTKRDWLPACPQRFTSQDWPDRPIHESIVAICNGKYFIYFVLLCFYLLDISGTCEHNVRKT